jgi:hypothetical protein
MIPFAKQSRQGLETQNRIAEFRLRIDRKRGEWLRENIIQAGNGSNQHEHKELQAQDINDLTKLRAKIETIRILCLIAVHLTRSFGQL